VQSEWSLYFREAFRVVQDKISEGVDAAGVTKLYNISHTFLTADRPNPFTSAPIGAGLRVDSDLWPSFSPLDRVEYIEFWYGGAAIFRKAHTSLVNEITDDIRSYSYISPAESIGSIAEIVLWGGDSATSTIGSGVELFRVAFVKTKTILESYQINAQYLKGA
jgi:hypothetical protein